MVIKDFKHLFALRT